ncbi:MAG: UDP-2,3-diacylglucosamine diphosphatase [Gammaproteobacteria bacterium]|nr:UDP-2,3-diacylglucosamine diphosphatase [Gammaproteobacteria bacterium]
MPALFVSDLHLPGGDSPLRESFIALLAGPARRASALYILGDLFEYWIGDDEGLVLYAAEVRALHALTAAGVPVYFQHGNRDFLVGRRFERATGVRLLDDPVVVDLGGVRTLLTHGDLLCTGDVRYQNWRRTARNPLIQALFLSLPRAWRRRIAGQVRARFNAETRQKPMDIMDASEDAVRDMFRRHGVTRIIHGHTHRPADHGYTLDGRDRQRVVLADWQPGRIEALWVDDAGTRRVSVG